AAGDHRGDRRLTVTGVEAEPDQPSLEVARVLPEAVDQLRLVFEHVDGRDAGGDDGRWVRGAEQDGPGFVDQEVAQFGHARDVAAERADGLRERADLDVDPPIEAEVVHAAAPVLAEHAAGMRVVYIRRRTVAFGQSHDLWQFGDVAIHAEDAVGE